MSDIPVNGDSLPNGFRERNGEDRNPLPVPEPFDCPQYLPFESEFM
jgi:hypothetical protein